MIITTSLAALSLFWSCGHSVSGGASRAQANNAIRQTYAGICDASAAVAIDEHRFLVAEDEIDILRLYRNDQGSGAALQSFDISDKLRDNPNRECDIEGAVRIGARIFWISSHGRNKDGKRRPNRHRFFATDIKVAPDSIALTWVGRYDDLIRDLLASKNWDQPEAQATTTVIQAVAKAARLSSKKSSRLAPKSQGLNIEALAATEDGKGLLVGFRNPAPARRAMVVQLQNPGALLAQLQESAHFGRAFLLDLHGLGLRSMAYSVRHQAYLIIAGPADSGGPFKVFKWARGSVPVALRELESVPDSSPEALVVYPGSRGIQILYDEGTKLIDSAKCKDLPLHQRSFTGNWLQLRK